MSNGYPGWLSVFDANGYRWIFDETEGRIFVEGDDAPEDQRGYACESLEEGIRTLNEHGCMD